MYRCEFCKKCTAPGVPCILIPTANKTIRHPYRYRVNRAIRIEENKKKRVYVDDPGGDGSQIVRESKACPDCAIKHDTEKKYSK